MDVVDVVKTISSPWFFGPRGLVLASPQPCAYTPAVGQPGYFSWSPAKPVAPEPALWMLPKEPSADAVPAPGPLQIDMFG